MHNGFKKVIRLGAAKTLNGRSYSIFCYVEFNDGRLSITGVEGPTRGGNAIGVCGQIVDSIRSRLSEITPAPGWDRGTISRFLDFWGAWHLNDLTAGSPAQQAWLEAHKSEDPTLKHYEWATASLAAAGLNPDPTYLHNGKPYAYGSAWLRREVPEDVLSFLRDLPETDREPAWV